ncbi:hypothetical protein LEP1GSC170_3600 [Leptospira interrogans serovar Bataviae str. HAI135]|nr:hypothetical protein LEP1GSC170_3600 [Leptospira interrogans serovar Bataviae str. HAI135]
MPGIEARLVTLRSDLSRLNNFERELAERLKRAGAIEELEEVVNRLRACPKTYL